MRGPPRLNWPRVEGVRKATQALVSVLAVGVSTAVGCTAHRAPIATPAQEVKDATAVSDTERFWLAMNVAIAGDVPGAQGDLEELLGSAEPGIQEMARALLSQLMRLESDWGGLAELTGDGTGTDFPGVMAAAPEQVFHIPIEPVTLPAPISPTGVLTVQTSVNGVLRDFWLDTGAGMSVVTEEVAEAAGITPLVDEDLSAGTATSLRVSAKPAVVESLVVGTVAVRNHPVLIIDEGSLNFEVNGESFQIDGILGWPFLQRLRVELDYGSETVTFAASDGEVVDNPSLFWLGFPMVSATARDQSLTFGLDTGAQQAQLFDVVLARFPDLAGGPTTHTGGGAGGYETVDAVEISELAVFSGGQTFDFAEMSAIAQTTDGVSGLDGIFGSDIGQGRTMTIDFPRRVFAVK